MRGMKHGTLGLGFIPLLTRFCYPLHHCIVVVHDKRFQLVLPALHLRRPGTSIPGHLHMLNSEANGHPTYAITRYKSTFLQCNLAQT